LRLHHEDDASSYTAKLTVQLFFLLSSINRVIICVLQTLPVVDVQLAFALSKQWRLPASAAYLHQAPVGGCA
jgi:hypothetical protein